MMILRIEGKRQAISKGSWKKSYLSSKKLASLFLAVSQTTQKTCSLQTQVFLVFRVFRAHSFSECFSSLSLRERRKTFRERAENEMGSALQEGHSSRCQTTHQCNRLAAHLLPILCDWLGSPMPPFLRNFTLMLLLHYYTLML